MERQRLERMRHARSVGWIFLVMFNGKNGDFTKKDMEKIGPLLGKCWKIWKNDG
jgi:hypothetical protein